MRSKLGKYTNGIIHSNLSHEHSCKNPHTHTHTPPFKKKLENLTQQYKG